MTLRFGTDGVRGVAGVELTAEYALALGRAAARVLARAGSGSSFLVGRDTRWSGPMLQAAFSAGVASEGVDVVDLGVIPTPGVAAASVAARAPAAVISASHNPFADNGIKLLAAGGRKLSDADEQLVEEAVHGLTSSGPAAAAAARSGRELGRLGADPDALGRYVDRVVAALEGRRLDGLRVAVDCGHGASVATARQVLERAGATVVSVLGDAPDGTNINDGCGSTDPSGLAAAVRASGAAAGLAFDGDADRVIAVDEMGQVVDGDRLIALFATDRRDRGHLPGGGVVVTVMTNLGFHRAMAAAGIAVEVTSVGDRYVLERLESTGWALGGEQSGHIIFGDLATTGDGVLTGLLLLDLLTRRAEPLSVMAEAAMTRFPQVLLNVRVADHRGLDGAAAVWEAVASEEAALGGQGRVLLRPSGTEPVVRVMVEAPTEEAATETARRLAGTVEAALGPPSA